VRIVFHPRVFSEIDAIMKYYEGVADAELARINRQLRSETQREAGWSKAGAGLWKGCMRTYRPHRNPSPTPLRPASRKSQ